MMHIRSILEVFMSMVARIKNKSGTVYSVEVWAGDYDESEVTIERPLMKKSILRSIDPAPRIHFGISFKNSKKSKKSRRKKK